MIAFLILCFGLWLASLAVIWFTDHADRYVERHVIAALGPLDDNDQPGDAA